jgi:hypothetical protein
MSTAERVKMKKLEYEDRELRRASAVFAAEHDHPQT